MKKFYIFISFFIVFLGCVQKPVKKNNETQSHKDSISFKHKEVVADRINKVKMPAPGFTKGIYLSASTIASDKVFAILDSARIAGINTVIFDLKNMFGDIFFSTLQKSVLTQDNVKPIINIDDVVNLLHSRNMRAVARVVMFHDRFVAITDSTLRPKYMSGSSWIESKVKGPNWLDPSNILVQNRLLSFIEEIAYSNIDEIQMDYIRFPTQGKIEKAIFNFEIQDSILFKEDSTYVFREKSEIIVDFIRRAKKICEPYGVSLTADIFAIVAWQSKKDVKKTGQKIKEMSRYVDSIHPMVYSSHFAKDFGFRKDVPNEPYLIVYKCTKLSIQNSDHNCKIIPYIQANSWQVKYTKKYILAQIQAVKDAGADGYILWNAANIYYKTLNWIKGS